MVVEDTELLRRIYSDKLTQEGYTVISAADGLECIAHLHQTAVDLILLDLIMPRMSGLEVLDTVKKDPRTKDIPVIVLTNLGQEADVERGIAMGAIDYLVKNEAKPADVAEKIRVVLAMTGGRHGEPEAYRVLIRDHEADADGLVAHLDLKRRVWCPACETELMLELIPRSDKPGWFEAHMVCPSCEREFGPHII